MISKLILRDFKSYVGWNEIYLNSTASISAILGKNGSGKSTILQALAFATVSVNVEGISNTAMVQIELEDSSIFCRRGGGNDEYFVNGNAHTLESYREEVASKLQLKFFSFDGDWQLIFSSPNVFLDFMLHIDSQDNAASMQFADVNYMEAVEEEERYAKWEHKTSTELRKQSKELLMLQNAMKGDDKTRSARIKSNQLRAELYCWQSALAMRNLEAINKLINQKQIEREYIQKVISSDNEVLKSASFEFENIKSRTRELHSQKANIESQLAIKQGMRESMLSRSRINIEISQLHSIDNKLRRLLKTVLESRLQGIKAQADYIYKSEPIKRSDFIEIKSSELRRQLDLMRVVRFDVKKILNDLDERMLKIINNMESYQKSLGTIRVSIDQCDTNLLSLNLQLQEMQIEAERSKLAAQFEPSMVSSKGLGTMISQNGPSSAESVQILKLIYPQILGELHEFIHPKNNNFCSRRKALDILKNVTKDKTELVLIVETNDDAIELAKHVSSYNSQQVAFLAGTLGGSMIDCDKVTCNLVEQYPDVIPLSSLFETDSIYGNHLIDYATQGYLIVKDANTASAMMRDNISYDKLCDMDGFPYVNGSDSCLKEISVAKSGGTSHSLEKCESRLHEAEGTIISLTNSCKKLHEEEEKHKRLANDAYAAFEIFTVQHTCIGSIYDEISNEISTLEAEIYLVMLESRKSASCLLPAVDSPVPSTEIKNYLNQLGLLENRLTGSLDDILRIGRAERLKSMNSIPNMSSVSLSQLSIDIDDLDEAICRIDTELSQLKSDQISHSEYLKVNIVRPHVLVRVCEDIDKEVNELQLACNQHKRNAEKLNDLFHAMESTIDPTLYNQLAEMLENLSSTEEASQLWRERDELESHIKNLKHELEKYSNLAAESFSSRELYLRHAAILESVRALDVEAKKSRKYHASASERLAKLRETRYTKIKEIISRIVPYLEVVYCEFYSQLGNVRPQIYLKLVDEEDLDRGLSFYAIPSGKPFTPVSHLSSGEFCIALAAFQIAICHAFGYNLLLLDELDSHLDSAASLSLGSCLKRLCSRTNPVCKVVIATHQRRLYNLADQFIGLQRTDDKTLIFATSV